MFNYIIVILYIIIKKPYLKNKMLYSNLNSFDVTINTNYYWKIRLYETSIPDMR